ncbi:Beta-lactamase superfamily domain-containing protein [Acinetobacter kyonggiensis]|uniref:Beta-lactamase superfamily domain-containing protein n=1 Tax=Acinetobacter kyonggiensis TaxID=595670 RepID=A0A1H3GB50_9GAMM|nr:Beta-lactamase superfamily domain-containing protein [Acinetobacter kyonggiensis]
MMRKKYKVSLILIVVGIGILFTACTTLHHPQFGKLPEQVRLERIKQSPHYIQDEFIYPVATPMLSDGESTLKIFWDNFWAEKQQTIPTQAIPTVNTNLLALNPKQDVVIWLGHSAYYIQLAGKRILVDPVLSDHAAPFSFLVKAFKGSTLYKAEDIPEIDYLLISHDHYDHLDYATVTQLKDKVKNVVVPLGIGSHFEYWGYPLSKIHENDWFDTLRTDTGLNIHTLINRGNISIWFDSNTQWYAQPKGKQGRNQTYSDTAIQCCLMIKSLFRLSLGMVTGFVQSLIKLCCLDSTAPNISDIRIPPFVEDKSILILRLAIKKALMGSIYSLTPLA